MLNYVNGKIPNKLGEILKSRNLTVTELARQVGMVRPTVVKLVEGEDSYLSKMALLCDYLGVTLSEVYGTQSYHQENHAHDNSRPTMIGYQFNQAEISHLKQRIDDLENLVDAKDKVIKMYESKSSD